MIQPTHFLGLPAHLLLDQIEITAQTLMLSLAVDTAEAACPLCQQSSHRVHNHYTRTLADLPCGRKMLRLLVLVRRFFVRWTLALAAEVCFEQGLTETRVCIETVRQALLRLGVGWQRAKHWITSMRRVGAYEISVKHGRGRERRPLGQELTQSRKAKVDSNMLEKRKAEEGM
ncbi:MAG TPA: transposase family protein [Ktedonobacteraceae bacterium]|nr:transposase family protein [Ktedonobacteraceae bacterium]